MKKATEQAPPRFVRAYIHAMLWSTNDDNDQPLEDNYGVSDLSPESLAKIVEDCGRFLADVESAGIDLDQNLLVDGDADERAAFHFWLTRNGHGAGFWDGDWSEAVEDKLTKLAESFGEVWPYVGDDGQIYI